MAHVYAVAGGKGGVGKTTTAMHMASAFQAQGEHVVLLDADLAMSDLARQFDVPDDRTIHDVLAGDVALRHATTELATGYGEGPGTLEVLPGSHDLEAFARADPAKLPPIVERLRDRADVIVLDTGSGVSRDVAIPLGIADRVVVVTTPVPTAISDTLNTIELVDHVESGLAGVVIARFANGESDETVLEELDAPHLVTVPDIEADPDGANIAFGELASELGETAAADGGSSDRAAGDD
jgi:septum site-determining protein MinD